MTAVANLPSFQQNRGSPWSSNVGQGGLNAMNADDVTRMFMPRKSVQRASSSSSLSSNSSTSSTGTVVREAPPTNGVPMTPSEGWGSTAARKKAPRAGPWPTGKAEPISGVTGPRQPVLMQNGATPTSIHQPNSVLSLPSQQLPQSTQQANGIRAGAVAAGEENPVLYLLSMNGTFERKMISVPYFPDRLRIGRQTNAKTVPAPSNAFFDSKVLSRQHAEIWADRNGKIWIRDVKSSNGTFVNGARLSAEARESEPHELQTQDHLELGIDIVSEDQKTVVHHKVAAKVEHAGFLAPTNNVLDVNFGDLDPTGSSMMAPPAGNIQMRARTSSQGSVGSNGRMGPPSSTAGSQISAMGHQRPMNFWLTPVTTEQIVKRLNLEMRTARLQNQDLARADNFVGSLLMKDDGKDRIASADSLKPVMVNGAPLPFRTDISPRFSEPPAPPPQQPLPEKPDAAKSNSSDSPSLRRMNTERPRSATNASPVREQNSSQILNLVEALATAKKQIDTQEVKLRDLEEMLQKERQAREMAEEVAKRLELESEARMNGHAKSGATLANSLISKDVAVESTVGDSQSEIHTIDPVAISDSSTQLNKKIELMLSEMKELKEEMATYKQRAEMAEAERDEGKKTLAEMVEKIRSEEFYRQSSSAQHSRSVSNASGLTKESEISDPDISSLDSLLEKAEHTSLPTVTGNGKLNPAAVGTLSKSSNGRKETLAYHTTPYASMLGVVLVGMGLMAYLNGWQHPKVDG